MTTYPSVGHLAREYAQKRLPLKVMGSAAGFYIGTEDSDCGPCSRESVEYFPSPELAHSALDTGDWTQKEYP